MGGGPAKEVLLFIFSSPEPTRILTTLRTQFPHIEVLYHRLTPPKPSNAGGKLMGGIPYSFDAIPSALWHRVTILVTLGTLPSTQELVPNLQYVHLLSAGIDHFASHWLFTSSKIPITTVSGIHGPPIAEWVTMSLLALTKNYAVLHRNQKRHVWDSSSTGLMRRSDWVGKTVGIVGYGSIGRQVARVVKALGCKVHAYTAGPRPTRDSRVDSGYVVPGTGDAEGVLPDAWFSKGTEGDVGLHTFLGSGLDACVNCLPLTGGTRGVFGREEFEVLGRGVMGKGEGGLRGGDGDKFDGEDEDPNKGCWFVNLSRGATVQTDALIEALQTKVLCGAVLDVTDPEPLPEDSPLWDMENVIVTPHVSGLGREYVERAFDVLRLNLGRRERGERMVNVVNRGTGYRG